MLPMRKRPRNVRFDAGHVDPGPALDEDPTTALPGAPVPPVTTIYRSFRSSAMGG